MGPRAGTQGKAARAPSAPASAPLLAPHAALGAALSWAQPVQCAVVRDPAPASHTLSAGRCLTLPGKLATLRSHPHAPPRRGGPSMKIAAGHCSASGALQERQGDARDSERPLGLRSPMGGGQLPSGPDTQGLQRLQRNSPLIWTTDTQVIITPFCYVSNHSY